MDVEEEEESVDEVKDVISEILAYGLKHGNVDNPAFQQRLVDAIRKDDAKPVTKKKSAFSLRKQEKKKKAEKARKKEAHDKSGEHASDSSEDTIPIELGTGDAFSPVTKSSFRHLKNALPDDTPIYEKEQDDEVVISGEGETSEDRELIESIQKMSLSAEEKLIKEGLAEIRQQLENGNIPAYRLSDPGWLSAFVTLNTTEVLGEEELNNFIAEYARTRTNTL